MHKIFTDAYKSPLSCLILDDIERLIEWNPVGPRLSNTILQALITLLQTPPPKGHRLLILATTSQRSVMESLDIVSAFDRTIPVPAIKDLRELGNVLNEFGSFGSGADINEALNLVQTYSGSELVGVGIKPVLTIAESATMSAEPAQWFAEQLGAQIARNNPRM